MILRYDLDCGSLGTLIWSVSEFKIVDSNYFLFSIFLSFHLLFLFSFTFIFGT